MHWYIDISRFLWILPSRLNFANVEGLCCPFPHPGLEDSGVRVFSGNNSSHNASVCSTDACCLFYCSQTLSALAPSSRQQWTPAEHEGLCASLHAGRSQLQIKAINKLILGVRGSGRRRGLCKTSLPASELGLHKAALSEKAPVPTFPSYLYNNRYLICSKMSWVRFFWSWMLKVRGKAICRKQRSTDREL